MSGWAFFLPCKNGFDVIGDLTGGPAGKMAGATSDNMFKYFFNVDYQ